MVHLQIMKRLFFIAPVLFFALSADAQSRTRQTRRVPENPNSKWESTQTELLKDLQKVASPGLPGAISAFNDRSFVVLPGQEGKHLAPVIAAGEMPGRQKGRIVVFGHDGYFNPDGFEQADTAKLAMRLANWAAGKPISGNGRSKPGKIGLVNRPGLETFFAKEGWAVAKFSGDWTKQLGGVDVVLLTAGDLRTPEQAKVLSAFLGRGGGVLFGITGWGWEQVSGGKSLVNDFPFSPLLAEAGLAITNATANATGPNVMNIRPVKDLRLIHAGEALKRLQSAIDRNPSLHPDEVGVVSATLLLAMRSTKFDEPTFREPLMKVIGKQQRRVISPKQPVNQENVLERLAAQFDFEFEKNSSPGSIRANPSAKIFPGEVPSRTPKVRKTVTFAAGNKGRMGTGLYAAPGTVIDFKVVNGDVKGNRRIRIGAHSDTTWHLDRWERYPEISRTYDFPNDSKSIQVASPFGGLIYVEVDRPLTTDLQIEIGGCVEAPHYVLGQTDLKEWDRLRKSGAPWAELQSKHVGLVLPSSSIRDLADPKSLMELWDRIIETQDQLGRLNDGYKPIQWIVPDQQISAGYMHSGNPIMTFLDVVPWFSRVDKVLASGLGGTGWGILHEIGHNRQQSEWTPGGLGEVTNNLFALYVYDKMLGKPSSGHGGLLVGEARKTALEKYRATGPDFNKFKSDPFLALAFFMEIQETYGWEPFIKFFAEVDKMPGNQRPQTDVAKWDNWLVGMSKQTGKNLGPLFKQWGIPVTEPALTEAAKFQ